MKRDVKMTWEDKIPSDLGKWVNHLDKGNKPGGPVCTSSSQIR